MSFARSIYGVDLVAGSRDNGRGRLNAARILEAVGV